MQKALRQSSLVGLLLLTLLVPTALAQSDALRDAVKQFEGQEYVAAQRSLADIDTGTLSDDEKATHARLTKQVVLAIAGAEKARQNASAANIAFEAGRLDEADRLYQGIVANEYASAALKDAAGARRVKIAQRRKLASVARAGNSAQPMETMEPVPANRPAAAPAQPMQATESTPAPAETAVAPAEPTAGPRRMTLIEQARARDELFWQRAVAKMNEFASAGRAAVLAEDFPLARQNADAALQEIEAARTFATPASKYENARDAAITLRREIDDAAEAFGRDKARRQRQEIVRQMEDRTRIQEEQKQEQIAQLFNTFEVLREQQDYSGAVEVLRQILVLDPTNAKADFALGLTEELASASRQQQARDRRRGNTRDVLSAADELLDPVDTWTSYPENWIELAERRGNLNRGAGTGDEHSRRVEMERRLGQPVSEIMFDELMLEEIVDQLRERYDVNISADWLNLEEFGLDLQMPVSVDMKDTTVLAVLNDVVAKASLDIELALDIGTDGVSIVPQENLSVYGRQYDVLHAIPEDQTGGGFDEEQDQEEEDWEERRDKIEESVIPAIRGAEPGIWEDIRTDVQPLPPNYIMVTQTFAGHKRVDELVKGMGTGGSGRLQAAFEARFLTITSNFLEQIGVDLDFVFNSGTAGYDPAYGADGGQIRDAYTGAPVLLDRNTTLAGFHAQPPALGQAYGTGAVPNSPYNNAAFIPQSGGILPTSSRMTPIPMQQNSLDLADAAGLNTGVPGSLNDITLPAMSIAASFLDNLQVDFLIRATQANKRSSVVQAPRLLVAHGESGQIRIVRQFQTVGDLEGAVGENTGIASPGEADEPEQGITMTLRNVRVTANHQYVNVNIRIENNGEPIITPFTVQRASGNSPGITVEKYEQDQNTINTVASIPDGGTVLLGGIKRVGEAEIDVGVPILSQIPILKRAFTNTSTVKDTQTIYVLLKASIIIPEEAEADAFPTLGSTGG